MRRQMTIERGSAGGLPTVPSFLTSYGSSPAALTVSPMSGSIRASSFLLKALYLFQSLGFDLLPWLLGFLFFFFLPRLIVFQRPSPAQIESRTPSEMEERERGTQSYHGVMMLRRNG